MYCTGLSSVRGSCCSRPHPPIDDAAGPGSTFWELFSGSASDIPTRSADSRPPANFENQASLDDTASMVDRNVLGGELEPCGGDPVTGFYRDGCCHTGPEDLGSHTICAVVTAEFLDHQRGIGNDLSTPMPQFGFPGLIPGDRWCVTAANWLRSHR